MRGAVINDVSDADIVAGVPAKSIKNKVSSEQLISNGWTAPIKGKTILKCEIFDYHEIVWAYILSYHYFHHCNINAKVNVVLKVSMTVFLAIICCKLQPNSVSSSSPSEPASSSSTISDSSLLSLKSFDSVSSLLLLPLLFTNTS